MSDGLRIPPHSAEAERAVLGVLLCDPWNAIAKVKNFGLSGAAFYDPRHDLLFTSVLEMAEEGRAMDAITIMDYLKHTERLEKIGGQMYLVELQDPGLSFGHVEHYADIVRQAWIKREVLEQLRVVEAMAYTMERGDELLKKVPEKFMSIVDEALKEETQADTVNLMMADFERAAKGEKLFGLELPWDNLNQAMCGLPVGLGIIAARPSMGKTTVEDILACHFAKKGVPVARVTMDMTRDRLLQRAASRSAGVSLPKIKKGFVRYGGKGWDQLEEAAEDMRSWPMYINDTDNNLAAICTWIRMVVIKYGVKFVSIDYIQQIYTGGRIDNDENTRVTVVSGTLKQLFKTLGIHGVVLSQLNRGSARDNRKPTMADVRSSGAIEQDAVWMWLLYKDTDVEESKTLRPVWIDMVKQQDGECAAFPFWMYPNYFQLEPTQEIYGDDGTYFPFGDLKQKQEQQNSTHAAEASQDIEVEINEDSGEWALGISE